MGTTPEPRESEINALYRIASIGGRGGDLATSVREVLRAIPDVVPCQRALVFVYDDEKDDLRAFASRGEEQERLSLHEPGIVKRVFNSGRAEIVNDVRVDPESNPMFQDKYATRQIALAPLVQGDARLGVIAAVDSRGGVFTDRDLHLLSVLADRASTSISQAQLRATVDRQARELEGLQRLARLLVSQESVEYVIGESVRIISDLVDCEKMMLLLYDEDKNALVVQQPAVGIDADEVAELEISLAEPSLAGTVFRTSSPMTSNDAENDAWVEPWLRDRLGIRNALAVPLISDRESIGVLQAINATKGYFDEDDERFTALLGSRVGGAVELSRARLRERELVQKLREADRAKSDFVSILAHELKGPMTTIMGFGQTLEQNWSTLEDERRTQFLGIVHRETERLSHMVSDLLDMSRMESGTLRFEADRMELGELVDNIVTVHSSLTAQHGIKIEIPSDLPAVHADRDRIRQVLLNLITNATRYSPEGTTITIGAKAIADEGPEVQVWVADEGIGIAREDSERIFSKFAMLPKPAWTKKGTGLGLFITKGIIDAHGGRLWVDSDVGAGAKFCFTLPHAS
ncbi:MAG: GAF domain-containing protein [Actinomycetota bacterium]|nr:GAF domain-containing protein [Actinomycetota bacterium]